MATFNLTRRNFIKGGMVGAAGIAAAGALAGCSSPSKSTGEENRWLAR